MDTHLRHLIESIQIACKHYIEGTSTVADLQMAVCGNASAIEIDDIRKRNLSEIIKYFDSELEEVQYMYSIEEQREQVVKEILNLQNSLKKIIDSYT